MKGYYHKGPVKTNGYVDTSEVVSDYSKLKLMLGDDSFHLSDHVVGNFEWWYFDFIDNKTNCAVKIVIHIGTNVLKTRIYTKLALSVHTPEKSESITRLYQPEDLQGSAGYCQINIGKDVEAWVEYNIQLEYFVKVNIPEFSAELHFISEIEGWKPSGDRVLFQNGKKGGYFMWIIPVPKARVNGYFVYNGNNYEINNAIGYHDHNYWSVDKKKPLHLDAMVSKWYWGKCYCNDYTIIFMDTYFRKNRLRSLMVAKNDQIIHSSNNLVHVNIDKFESDQELKSSYPSRITVKFEDKLLSVNILMKLKHLTDKKDLLEGIPRTINRLIKSFVAKPVYYGILADVELQIDNQSFKGFGNYEYMLFRD